MIGNTVTVLLWAIDDRRNRIQVGEIKNCQVLTADQSSAASTRYKEVGRLQSMQEDVVSIGAQLANLDIKGLYNVDFKNLMQLDTKRHPYREER